MIVQERTKEGRARSSQMRTSAENPITPELADTAETALYLADLLESAKDIAGKAGLTFLFYLIQVAVEEARIQAAEAKAGVR